VDTVLKEAFLILFGIACINDGSVTTFVDFFASAIQWNVSFTRLAHDWEV
jgi:hypothetical protein